MFTTLRRTVPALAFFVAAACSGPTPTTVAPGSATSDAVQAASDSVQEFGFDLQRALPADGGLAYSPLSIALALSMTADGATGETQAELLRALHLEAPAGEALQGLLHDLLAPHEGAPTIRLANSYWYQPQLAVRDEYVEQLRTRYAADAFPADFAAGPDDARVAINAWVAYRTENLIPELFPRPAITTDTRLVLVNAVHFDGLWKTPFETHDTTDEVFTTESGETVTVPFLTAERSERVLLGDDVAAVALPYRGDAFELWLLLPPEDQTTAELEQRLSGEQLRAWESALESRRVDLRLPKFEVRRPVDLVGVLSDLGVVRVFDRQQAELGGISDEELFVQAVRHECHLRVDELGTEAAAATGVAVGTLSMPAEQVPVLSFDRPFVFLLRHRPTGAVLFAGRVTDPR